MFAVILAGGRGRRLLPYTQVIPKPLMPVGEMPILELLLRQLRAAGVRECALAVGYQAALLEAYVGDGARFGLRVRYSREEQPLGTAGPIALVPDLPDRFFVMNGDLLCDVNFAAMWRAHAESGAAATIGCTTRRQRLELGVLRVSPDGRLTGYDEKPTLDYTVSMGVYVFNRAMVALLPRGAPRDLPALALDALARGLSVRTFRHDGHWLDIGNHADYEEANRLFAQHPSLFLPPDAPG
ncbi:MAG: NTP transferase domain-containing protein [Planctomycetes bacterium]|nr:NTP transferase domain-containing protein [Planctomycetota bacterium]